jgi:hypothetical protein
MNNLNEDVDEIIDIEEYAKQGKTPPKGKKYRIKVDRETLIAPRECMLGSEILELAGKTPFNQYQLYQRLKSNRVEKVAYDQTVCFTDPGVEKFTTQKLSHTDGESSREFKLLEEDKEFLTSSGFVWEAIIENNMHYVILRGINPPSEYGVSEVDVAIRMDTGYPRTQLDMAYFYPKLTRKDGKIINAVSDFPLEGRVYQQWSRHRTPDNPWIEGIDCLATHIGFMRHWLENEFKKNPYAVPA